MTEKEKIKELLPDGSYAKIAQKIGKTYGTVRNYFAPSSPSIISERVESELLQEAKKIIEELAWNGLAVAHGEEKMQQAKEAIAA